MTEKIIPISDKRIKDITGQRFGRNRRLTFNGQNLTIAQWADKLGVPRETLYTRLNKGWPVEKILTTDRQR